MIGPFQSESEHSYGKSRRRPGVCLIKGSVWHQIQKLCLKGVSKEPLPKLMNGIVLQFISLL